MAPIVKDGETSVATATLSTPGNSALKSPNETPTRPQPVALEIPVTINGARTVEGSDKREPFSETTQTVLVFGHGAVVRVATPLAAGQLVFLTNEKTKKEVVAQVVKSKSAGSANGYVELQFTEPAPGFWGLRIPGGPPAAAPTPTQVSRPTPAPQTTIPPASPDAARPATVLPKTVTPGVPPPSQVTMLHPLSTQPVVPATPLTPSLKPAVPNSPASGTPPVPAAPPQGTGRTTESPAPSPNLSAPGKGSTPPAQPPPIPQPPLRDYAKEIDALFSAPSSSSHPAPATPPPSATPPSSEPSTEELKLQAARLQAELSSLLFTETPAAKPPAPVIRVTPKTDAPQATQEVAKKVLEAVPSEPKPIAKTEPQTAQVIRKPASPLPSAEDEEVRIPAWLAPISRNSEAGVTGPPPASSAANESVAENPAAAEGSSELFAEDSSGRSEATVFGGQLLGEAAPEEVGAPPTESNKKLFFVLAAAAILVALGGLWYFRGILFASSPAPVPQAASLPASAPATIASSPLLAAKATPAVTPATALPVTSSVASAATPTSQPSKPIEPVSVPVDSPPVPQPRNSPPAAAKTVPEEPAKKPALGEVRLGAPVVTRGTNSLPNGEALPSIDTKVSDPGTDSLANVATTRSGAPSAPLLVGGEVTPAQLIKSVPPIYPPIAKTQRISGNVQLDALIDASGNVAEVKVISGPSILHRAALDAVKQWKYKPAVLDGQVTTMHLTVTVQFRTQ